MADEMADNLFQGRKSVALNKGFKNTGFGRSPLSKWDTMGPPQVFPIHHVPDISLKRQAV
jgi:hypothetical protein